MNGDGTPLLPGVLADLAWDNPQRPSGDDADDWQGIERLELSIHPPGSMPAASLRVFLLLAPSFPSEYSVRLSGPQALSFILPPLPPFLPFLQVDFEQIARGTYYVSLEVNEGATYPVHPFFASASFSFTIDCEAGDCRPPAEPLRTVAPSRQASPAVDLLTKDFDGFVRLLGERVRVQNPDWSDLASASFERVVLELIAHQADMLSYFQDRVANEAFLDSASQRFSVRQHGLLLGYRIFDGEAASTLLSFSVAHPLTVPEGLAVRTKQHQDEVPVVFSVTAPVSVEPGRNPASLVAAQWPQAYSARVPAGAKSMLLLGWAPALQVGQTVALVSPIADTELRELTKIERLLLPGWGDAPTESLSTTPAEVTRIHWALGLSQAHPIWALDAGECPLRIHGNIVAARHGQWRRARLRASPTDFDDSQPDIALSPQSAIVIRSPLDEWHLRALRLPEATVLFDRSGETLEPAVEVTLDGEPWFLQEHLQRSQPFDRHFTAELDSDGRLWLRFGDNRRGQAIPVHVGIEQTVESARLQGDSELRIRYRIGAPLSGNVGADRLVELVPNQSFADLTPSDLESITNITPAAGGRQPETLDAARLQVPAELRRGRLERAVTLGDYARLAELSDSRVARATARRLGGLFRTVLVLVDPRDEAELDEALKTSLERALNRGRMVGREVLVRGAETVPLDVELVVCAEPGFAKHETKQAVLRALRPGNAEWPGFFHPNRLSFGQDVKLSDVLAEAQSVPGVLAVKALIFRRLRASGPDVLSRIDLGTTEVARLDADDLVPENGRLVVRVAGLDDVNLDLFEVDKSSAVQGVFA